MFCLYTSNKLYRSYLKFSLKVKMMGSNAGYLFKSFLHYKYWYFKDFHFFIIIEIDTNGEFHYAVTNKHIRDIFMATQNMFLDDKSALTNVKKNRSGTYECKICKLHSNKWSTSLHKNRRTLKPFFDYIKDNVTSWTILKIFNFIIFFYL